MLTADELDVKERMHRWRWRSLHADQQEVGCLPVVNHFLDRIGLSRARALELGEDRGLVEGQVLSVHPGTGGPVAGDDQGRVDGGALDRGALSDLGGADPAQRQLLDAVADLALTCIGKGRKERRTPCCQPLLPS